MMKIMIIIIIIPGRDTQYAVFISLHPFKCTLRKNYVKHKNKTKPSSLKSQHSFSSTKVGTERQKIRSGFLNGLFLVHISKDLF